MAMIDTSIVLIALPDIFKGIHINPLEPGNTFYLLWMILGFMIVTDWATCSGAFGCTTWALSSTPSSRCCCRSPG
jgi:hypothetical protein